MLWTIRGLGDCKLHALDGTVKAITVWPVIRRHRGAGILSDVAAVIRGEDYRRRHFD
jgi:hypothetical protein